MLCSTVSFLRYVESGREACMSFLRSEITRTGPVVCKCGRTRTARQQIGMAQRLFTLTLLHTIIQLLTTMKETRTT